MANMCFPKSISRINLFYHYSNLTLILLTNFFLGCSATKIYQEIPPSRESLKGINAIFIDQFEGNQSLLFEKILNHEIDKHKVFKNLEIFPNDSSNNSAILSADVTRYFVKDLEKNFFQKKMLLVEKKIPHNKLFSNNNLKSDFEFVEKSFTERVIHRILDLEFTFKLKSARGDKILFSDKENASLKLSYFGNENILLIPDSKDEMARLSQLLIQKFLDKINPEPKETLIELEKGSRPLPWTLGLIDFGHPKIVRSNYFATGGNFDLALKGWNYVLFEPKLFPESEKYFFTNDVFISLKKAELPHSILQKLFTLHGKSFGSNEIDIVLLGLISNHDFEKYARMIKYSSRFDQKIDRINLASAHYNLGTVYHLQKKFELASYHFAKANAYNPQEKYSQSWIEIQHLIGNYNPLINNRSIKSFQELSPPENALLNSSE